MAAGRPAVAPHHLIAVRRVQVVRMADPTEADPSLTVGARNEAWRRSAWPWHPALVGKPQVAPADPEWERRPPG